MDSLCHRFNSDFRKDRCSGWIGIDDRIGVESGKKGIENWFCIPL